MFRKNVFPVIVLLFICFFFKVYSSAQIPGIGMGTQIPNSSAALDIFDTARGILIPRMTLAQRLAITNPAEGLLVYQLDSSLGFYYYSLNFWNKLSNTNNGSNSSLILLDSTSNYSLTRNLTLPSFLNYFGDGALGNLVATNGMNIANGSRYNKLTIPLNVTVFVQPAVRSVIYVKDTLFLYGTIDGSGQEAAAVSNNKTTNHLGATASGCYWSNSGYALYSNGFGSNELGITWEANQVPSTFFENFSGSYSKLPGNSYSDYLPVGANMSGQSMSSAELLKFVHFGVNISGGNGTGCSMNLSSTASTGGQGGAGLYILAKNIVFNGLIKLDGGNGQYVYNSTYPRNWTKSAGGGGGSCIIRTLNLISNSGRFKSTGGSLVGPYEPNGKGGNGAMLIINN
jgi:hypothetical protein